MKIQMKNINRQFTRVLAFLALSFAFYACEDSTPSPTPTSPPTGLPAITSFSPVAAKVGDVVTITGSNFGSVPGNIMVKFGGAAAVLADGPAPTATSVRVVVPDSHNGNISIAIAYTNGLTVTSSQSFTVLTQPTWNFANKPGVVTDSSGVWDNSTAHWTTDGGITNIAWSATNGRAIFGNGTKGTADVISINGGGITAKSITFKTPNGGNYTIDGGTLTITTDSITTLADASINSMIAGTVGLRKLGPGKLTLGGVNTYSGETNVVQGVLDASWPTTTISSVANISVASKAPSTSNSGQLKLPLAPVLTGKTFNIVITETGSSADFGDSAYGALVWSAGTATGTPVLKVNGITVTSGTPTAGGTTVTFSSTGGITVKR
jgi:autotransporter-associated beta strand protein